MARPKIHYPDSVWLGLSNSDREAFFRSECASLGLSLRPGPGLSPQSLYVLDFWVAERILTSESDLFRTFWFRHYDSKPSQIIFGYSHALIELHQSYPAEETYQADPEIQAHYMARCTEIMHKKLNKINDLENLKKRLTLQLH